MKSKDLILAICRDEFVGTAEVASRMTAAGYPFNGCNPTDSVKAMLRNLYLDGRLMHRTKGKGFRKRASWKTREGVPIE